MHQSIGKILPSDHFSVIKHSSFTEEHYQALYQFYQPIIGVVATGLYLTLQHQFHPYQKKSHHQLMQTLNLPLDTIYEARQACEAIGLIKTYKKKIDHLSIYHYELKTPLTSHEFLKNDLLNQLLLHQIGHRKHQEMQESVSSIGFQEGKSELGDDISATFPEVFNYSGASEGLTEVEVSKAEAKATPVLENDSIDWKWLEQSLDDRMLPAKKILTDDNSRLIRQMASLYQLTTTQLDKAIQWAITSDHELNRTEFKAACLDMVETLPKRLHLVDQREKLKQDNQDEKSQKELFIERMETISPKELLEDLSNGNQASQQDLKMIANVMDAQGIEPGVMNVLIHYVMLKTDMKLTRSYLEKIASHWARKNVKTVHQAMTLARSENNKYQQWDKKRSTYSRGKKNQDIVPDWFEKRKKKAPQKVTKSDQDINEILREFKNKSE